jgi:hypothetical protein
MRRRISSFLDSDGGKVALLVALILLLALGALKLGQLVSARMLRADALSTSESWAVIRAACGRFAPARRSRPPVDASQSFFRSQLQSPLFGAATGVVLFTGARGATPSSLAIRM